MTDSVGKTNASRKKRASTTKKAVAKKNTTDSSPPKKITGSAGIKKKVPIQPDTHTDDDLNSLNYPQHPERIWPD